MFKYTTNYRLIKLKNNLLRNNEKVKNKILSISYVSYKCTAPLSIANPLSLFFNFFEPLTLTFRSSPPEVFLGKGVLKLCIKFTREHPCQSVISINLLCNFIEITLRHGCSPVNLLHIFRTP